MKMTGKLRALPDGGTEVAGISEITITGLLAQFGSRVVEEVSNQMFTEFTSSLQQSLQATGNRAGDEKAKPLRAVPLVLAAVRNMIQKSFACSIMKDRTAGDGIACSLDNTLVGVASETQHKRAVVLAHAISR